MLSAVPSLVLHRASSAWLAAVGVAFSTSATPVSVSEQLEKLTAKAKHRKRGKFAVLQVPAPDIHVNDTGRVRAGCAQQCSCISCVLAISHRVLLLTVKAALYLCSLTASCCSRSCQHCSTLCSSHSSHQQQRQLTAPNRYLKSSRSVIHFCVIDDMCVS